MRASRKIERNTKLPKNSETIIRLLVLYAISKIVFAHDAAIKV